MFRTILTAILALAFLSSHANATFKDGLNAAKKGDFATAFAEWKPIADQGDAEAQFNLGWMYENGRGVPKVMPKP